MKNKINTRTIVQIGLMAALVYVGTSIGIRIPAGGTDTMLHLGNVFCLLSGLLFGGIPGGLAAGIGSGLFDLLNGFASDCLLTFFNKFMMAFVAGAVMKRAAKVVPNRYARSAMAAVMGSLTYIILYTVKNTIESRFIQGLPWVGVWGVISVKLSTSLTNGAVAIVVSLVLYYALRPALLKTHLIEPL